MFSNLYGYYKIHGNTYFKKINYEKIIKIILNQNYFIQADNQSFKNDNSFPWVNIL